MGFLTRTADTIYAIRFLRLLTTPWVRTGAYSHGLIDKNGKHLRDPVTSAERSKYNVFHRLVFNIKRLLNKIPLGKTTIASYLAALYLIKEHTGCSDRMLASVLKEVTGFDLDYKQLQENTWNLGQDGHIRSGHYTLVNDSALPHTGRVLAFANTSVLVESSQPVGNICGCNVYSAYHYKTKQHIYVTAYDLLRQ